MPADRAGACLLQRYLPKRAQGPGTGWGRMRRDSLNRTPGSYQRPFLFPELVRFSEVRKG